MAKIRSMQDVFEALEAVYDFLDKRKDTPDAEESFMSELEDYLSWLEFESGEEIA